MADNSQSRIARRKQKKAKKKPLWKKLFLIIGILVLAMVIGVGGTFAYFAATAPKLDAAKLDSAFSSKIYDKDGELFADLGDKQRTKISYDELPDILIDAVTATEDSRFFKHHGVDPKRVGGAVLGNISNGFGSQGASTLTQQLVEKSFLPPDKKISLKVQEMWLSLRLERKYSKEEIMEMYLNKVYYGSGSYGVAKAAQKYFGKTDLDDLTLPEAAILAGLPQRPTAYNPRQHPDLTEGRMDTVLKLMVKHGKISQEEADEARDTDIEDLLVDEKQESTPYEAFIQKVRKEVDEKMDADIYTDGLKVYTTLDPDIQDHVEHLLSDEDDNPIAYPEQVEDPEDQEMVDLQAGMVVLDSENGAIRAVGGGRDLENDGFNYATQLGRQPGSTMKPVLAYGPAIENEKWSTYHQINDDKPYEIAGTDKKVGNWDGQYRGDITMREALTESLNVPTLKTAEEVGTTEAQKFGEDLGLDFGDKDMTINDAIGGANLLTSPLEMASAYRAFANEGVSGESYSVTKVEYPDGRSDDSKPKQKSVISDYTSYMISDMLKSVVSDGTGTQADVPGIPVAGKTGTTNLEGNTEESPDSWFNGYTTDYTISVWTGYDSDKIGIPDTQVPLELFKNTMSYISEGNHPSDFTKPDSVVKLGVEKGSKPATLPSDYTPDDEIIKELFVKGNEPSEKSEKYDKLDPVENLSADYDEDGEKIKVQWDYDDDDSSFKVSAAVDDDEMKELSTTSDKSMDITSIEEGDEYTIQVVAVDDDDKSEPKETTVKLSDDDDKDEDDEELKPVSDLKASYDNGTIDVSWNYDGPSAEFEVDVTPEGESAQQQTVNSNGIKVDNAEEGTTYTIDVTPVDDNDDKGDKQSTTVSVPDDEHDNDDEEEEDQEDSNDQDEDEDKDFTTDSEDKNDEDDDEDDEEND